MEFDYKNVLIFGYGRSGQAVEDVLKKIGGVDYKIFDSAKGVSGGNYISKLNKKIINMFDLIVLSPGVSIYNKYIAYAERVGIKVIGELEFGYWFTNSPVIAITGTNGKTTTTMMTESILSKKYSAGAYGNIGVPLSNAYGVGVDYLVCEVSSFQLESTCMFKPYISVILNIAEDHLDRHKTLDNYINCKMGIIKNCTEKSLMVLNYDDGIVMEKTANIKGKKYYFSQFDKVKGVYINEGVIYSNLGKVEKIVSLDDIEHLSCVIQDVLASILVGVLLKVPKEDIIESLKGYTISKHRMEVVACKDNVKYIDDSKSTNVHSAIHALDIIKEKCILLLGGEDKKLNFLPLLNEYKHKIDCVVAFGKTKKKIAKACDCSGVMVRVAKNFEDGVKTACDIAKGGNAVLLSPACSSFDEFSSYAERGDCFVKIVKGYLDAKN